VFGGHLPSLAVGDGSAALRNRGLLRGCESLALYSLLLDLLLATEVKDSLQAIDLAFFYGSTTAAPVFAWRVGL
jgi:hypothetical protein